MKHPIRISASRLKTLWEYVSLYWKTKIGCLSGVYVGVMYIYLITCKVNGKLYVGRTIRDNPLKRWVEHRCAARKGRWNGIISRAIAKHGEEAFTFEVIEKVERLEDLPDREAYWIKHYDCLSPKGYNLETYQPNRILTEEGKDHLSRGQQGLLKKGAKTSRYIGVYRRPHEWAAYIGRNNIAYWKGFPSEDEASYAYDAVATHLYGATAKLNHPDRIVSPAEAEAVFRSFQEPKMSSQYVGVHFSETIGQWKGTVKVQGLKRATKVRIAETEREAAQFVDVIRVIYQKATPDTLNFPELYPRYLEIDEAWLKKRAYIPLTKGITKRGNRYWVRLGSCGRLWSKLFDSLEEAKIALALKRKELGMTWDL